MRDNMLLISVRRALSSLKKRNCIIRIAHRHIQPSYGRGHALRYRQTSGVIFCRVKYESRWIGAPSPSTLHSFRWIASRATSEEVFVLITVIECSPKFLDFALATVMAIAELLPLSCRSGHQSDVICRTLKKKKFRDRAADKCRDLNDLSRRYKALPHECHVLP